MIMRKTVLFLMFAVMAVCVSAQAGKAHEVLKKTQNVVSASGTIKSVVDIKGGGYSSACTVVMTRSKFTLDMNAMQVWFDGKTMWSYNKQIDEVNVTEPDKNEVGMINPYSLLDRWDKDFKQTYAGVEGGCHKIVLTPKTSAYDMKSATVYIRQNTYLPARFVITDKKGTDMTIVVKTFDDKVKVSDSYFVFDESKYPDAEIVDLR